MIDKYYEILGVTSNSSLNEVKNAYRARARELHPDLNRSENAHAEFILLGEAYEYLINKLTGKVYAENSMQSQTYATYERWQHNEATRARNRAEYYANTNYEEFEESEYYKTVSSAIDSIISHLALLGVIGLYIILPIVAFIFKGKMGLIGCLIIWFITIHGGVEAFREARFRPREFLRGIKTVLKTNLFSVIIINIFNIYVLLRIGLQTMISLSTLFLAYIIPGVIAFIIIRFIVPKYSKRSLKFSFCYIPSLVSILLLINYFVSFNATYETYTFTHQTSWYGTRPGNPGRLGKNSMINLVNGKYNDIKGIRMFMNFNSMENAYKIRYTFKDGLFGIRVMTGYSFYGGNQRH